MSGTIIVVSSCTATKLATPDGRPRWAESLYAGQQHVRLMRGIEEYRDAGHKTRVPIMSKQNPMWENLILVLDSTVTELRQVR